MNCVHQRIVSLIARHRKTTLIELLIKNRWLHQSLTPNEQLKYLRMHRLVLYFSSWPVQVRVGMNALNR